MKPINVLSLFDGMSCGQIALNKLGIKYDNYFASEIDKYAMQVTMKNYPNTKQIGSVVDVKGEDLPVVGLLIGGSSCQNFSFAGNRIGMSTDEDIEILTLEQYLSLKENGFAFKGESYLFWEYVRILKETKPKYFLLENVKMSKKWQDVISEAIGIEPIFINSRLLSGQNRPRIYWTNIPNVEQPKDLGIKASDILECDVDVKYNYSEKVMSRLDVTDVKRIGMGGYKVKAKEVFKIGTLLARHWKGMQSLGYPIVNNNNVFRKLTPIECERLQTVPDNYTSNVSNTQRYRMLGNGWTVDVIAHIFKNLK
jgi:site-specific DNA-cytosine methylase